MSDESDRRQRFLEQVNDGYAALHADPEESSAHTAQIAGWDAALADGLEDGQALVNESWGVLRLPGGQVQEVLSEENGLLEGRRAPEIFTEISELLGKAPEIEG